MILFLLTGAVLLLLLCLAFAPVEALGWWAGWFGETLDDPAPTAPVDDTVAPNAARQYLIYLSGVGVPSGDRLLDEEVPFVEALRAHLPHAVVISDIFPYAVANNGLTGRRTLGLLWRLIEHLRLRYPHHLLTWLVNLRNLVQVAVSVDHRYGPIYNLGVAQAICDGLYRHGYPRGQRIPITLVGSSGGGQIAVGAAPFIRQVTTAPIQVISLGGVIAADPGLLYLEQLVHLYGTHDWVPRIADGLFPGRWPIVANSPWNRARAQGVITLQQIGPMGHVGQGSYFDANSTLPDGQSYLACTAAAVAAATMRMQHR